MTSGQLDKKDQTYCCRHLWILKREMRDLMSTYQMSSLLTADT